MSRHTASTTVSFAHPFTVRGAEGGPWPPGIYEVEVDEETVEDLSFTVRRRIATILYLPGDRPGTTQAVHIEGDALEEALAVDAALPAPEADEPVSRDVRPVHQQRVETDRQPSKGWWPKSLTPPIVVPMLILLAVALAALFGPFEMPGTGALAAAAENLGLSGRP